MDALSPHTQPNQASRPHGPLSLSMNQLLLPPTTTNLSPSFSNQPASIGGLAIGQSPIAASSLPDSSSQEIKHSDSSQLFTEDTENKIKKDGGAFRERGGGHDEQHHGRHRRQPPQQEVGQFRRRRGLHLRPGQEAVRRRRPGRQEEVRPPRPGRRKVRRRAAVAEQEDLVERAGRGDAGVGLLRVARLPPAHHRQLRARARHGSPVRLVRARLERAPRRAAGGDVCGSRQGRRRAGEPGPARAPGHLLRARPEAVPHSDRRVFRGRGRRELLQLADGHLHRVRVRAHTAGAVREVPGPGGRVPVQHAGPAPEPVPEARQQGRPQQREAQEERLAGLVH